MSLPSDSYHVHLDPVGGIAGDMFIAAMLDLFPHALEACLLDLGKSGVLEHVDVALESGKSHGLAVQRFCVIIKSAQPRATGHYRDLKLLLQNSALDMPVLTRALDIFELLAAAESQVHGVAIDDVHFHEVADWDSVADIVAAASLIEHNKVSRWSCSCLPLGSGLVKTEHGMLPVPAPATLHLLNGLLTHDDGEPGERVTPTGAALVKYLAGLSVDDQNFLRRPKGVGIASGSGAGQRSLKHRPNIVRLSLIDTRVAGRSMAEFPEWSMKAAKFDHDTDQVAQLCFAIDDMTSEELAVALQYIRQSDGVIDVSHHTSFGKKGRMMFDVNVLCSPQRELDISRLCFSETSTLGMRVQFLTRRVLKREARQFEDAVGTAGAKVVKRPNATGDSEQHTLKIESDDLRRIPGLHARRERARLLAETQNSAGIADGVDTTIIES